MRLTLRTLLAYLDDTLPPAEAREIGLKVGENPPAQELIDRIKRVTRRRGLATPPSGNQGSPSDPNTVAEYLSDALPADQLGQFEKTCLESDVHLAEVAACHQILTLVLSEQVRVPPTAYKRMYELVKGRESVPDRKPGTAIPVGGVMSDERPPDHDDADAPLLLGLPAYSRTEPSRRWAARIAGLSVLLVALAVAVWMTWPPTASPRATQGPEVAIAPLPSGPKLPPAESPVPPPVEPEAPPSVPAPPPVPLEQLPPPRPASGDAAVAPKKDLIPKVTPPSSDLVECGILVEKRAVPVVVRQQMNVRLGKTEWVHVPPGEKIISSYRHVALPGYRAVIQLDTGVTLDLWGNLPVLAPVPVYEAAATPHFPSPGLDADLTLHVGRFYVSARKPEGATVRLRFAGQVWDLTWTDPKTEVVIELQHNLVPGPAGERPQTTVGLAVLSGQVAIKPGQYAEAVTLPKGGDGFWDSKGGPPRFKPDPGEESRRRQEIYLPKVQPYPDATQAIPALESLENYARRIHDVKDVRATFLEGGQDMGEGAPSPRAIAAAQITVAVFSAIGDLSGLADSLNDPKRPAVRVAAIEGLRRAIAREPQLAEAFRQVLVEKSRLQDAEADQILRLLRGFSREEMADPRTLDMLVNGLTSPAVGVAELSFGYLASGLDWKDPANASLFMFDAAAPPRDRGPAVAAWQKKAEELKKKAAEPRPDK